MGVNGTVCAIIELGIFFVLAQQVRTHLALQSVDPCAYYWLAFTILTGIWEFFYVTQKKEVSQMANQLIESNERVWTNEYSICVLLPWKFSKLFYSEYAAYADREYMNMQDRWSLSIEGTHAMICGAYSVIGLGMLLYEPYSCKFQIGIGAAMGSQLMNSILYMSEYVIQVQDTNNVNYNSDVFPAGRLLWKRPFMYINVFWTVMPCGILVGYLVY